MSERSKDGRSAREERSVERRRHWVRLIAEWEESGQTQVEFCRDREITVYTFRWWKSRLSRDGAIQSHPPRSKARGRSSRLVPVEVVPQSPAASSAAPLEVVLGSRSIRVDGDFDPATLSKLIQTVEGVSC